SGSRPLYSGRTAKLLHYSRWTETSQQWFDTRGPAAGGNVGCPMHLSSPWESLPNSSCSEPRYGIGCAPHVMARPLNCVVRQTENALLAASRPILTGNERWPRFSGL